MRTYTCPEIPVGSYVFRTELHAHTKPASHCSDIVPARLAEVYSSLGYDAVVLTNHIRPAYTREDCLRHAVDYREAAEAASRTGLTILFGVEMTFRDLWGDYLIYGVTPDDLETLYFYCHEGHKAFASSPLRRRTVVFAAHPYRNDRIGEDLHIPEVADGAESINLHPWVNSENGFMTRTAWRENLLTICGSDYHHETTEGMTAILTRELPKTEAGLRDLLRSGDYLFEVNGNIVIPSHRMIKDQA